MKFTRADGRVAIRARRAGENVHLFVEDSGIGIPRSALPRLGRPFTQVEMQMTRRHEGSGLGLAIARSMIELHGGSLRIRSEETIGTIVLVRLPAPTRARDRISAEDPAGPSEPAPRMGSADGQRPFLPATIPGRRIGQDLVPAQAA